MSTARHHPIRPWPAALLCAAVLASGCASLEWRTPSSREPVPDDPVGGARLLAREAPADAAALLRSALAEGRAPADALLFELGLVLLAPGIDDRPAARAAFDKLISAHPASPHRAAALGLRALLDQAKALQADNAALRDDLKRIMDIDLETQRQRRGTGG
ncbi:MAG: hypothetical protein HZA24_07225 [Nitrospirae bacterium]|nr:hypothetical protein [Nitrospirota bacterium]